MFLSNEINLPISAPTFKNVPSVKAKCEVFFNRAFTDSEFKNFVSSPSSQRSNFLATLKKENQVIDNQFVLQIYS